MGEQRKVKALVREEDVAGGEAD
jgi:hypothetical protein